MPGTDTAGSQVASLARADKPQCPCPESTPTVFSPSSTHFRTRTAPPPVGTPSGRASAGRGPLAPWPVGRFLPVGKNSHACSLPLPVLPSPSSPAGRGVPSEEQEGPHAGFESLAAAGRRGCVSGWSSLSPASIVRAFRILKSWMFAFQFHSPCFREPAFAPAKVNETYNYVTRFCMW